MNVLKVVISRIQRLGNNLDGSPLRGTPVGSLAVAQAEAPYVDMTRSGRRFHGGCQIIANGIAPVAAIPTVTATLGLYNNDNGSQGLSLLPDWLQLLLGSGTPAAGLTLYHAVFKPTNPPSANATGYGSSPLSGTARGSKGIWATALTAPAGINWSALFSTFQLAAANIGQGDNPIDLGGRIVIPPGYCWGFGILSGAGTTPLYGISSQWGEVELDLE